MDLNQFFAAHPQVAVALSGGTDSAYLLYEAAAHCRRIAAYFVHTPFQPAFEREDALRLGQELGVRVRILERDVLSVPEIRANPPERCYHCKRLLFDAIRTAAREDGFSVVLDGTNASDDASDRPGMRALREMDVYSPLQMCGLTKEEIRLRAREAGLSVWNKPAYACLATRIPTGEEITRADLTRTEQGEAALLSLGFTDVRIRLYHGAARIQLPGDQFSRALERREEILRLLRPLYDTVLLDLEVR